MEGRPVFKETHQSSKVCILAILIIAAANRFGAKIAAKADRPLTGHDRW